jgi:hypothetical protein
MLISVFLVTSVQTATVQHFTSKEGREILTLSGDIVAGDTDRFVAAVKEANEAGREVSGLRLSSDGGALLEAAKLADAVRFAKIATVVMNGTTCASACFVAFAAGGEKYASYSARIGVHGASSAGQDTTESKAATVAMAKMVKELGVPPAIIGQMVVTPPGEMVWLTPGDLQSMGVRMTGKPMQTAMPSLTVPVPNVPRASQAIPSNSTGGLAGSFNASLPTSKEDQWSAFVNHGLQLSQAQHGGTPLTSRGCQPELRVCNVAIMFKGNDGKDMMVRVTKDADEKTVSRDLCTFNEFGDVRECLDWDKQTVRKDMKNASGDWVKIN